MVFDGHDHYEFTVANAGIAYVADCFTNTLPLLLDGIACIGPTEAVIQHYAYERKLMQAVDFTLRALDY